MKNEREVRKIRGEELLLTFSIILLWLIKQTSPLSCFLNYFLLRAKIFLLFAFDLFCVIHGEIIFICGMG
jgi:hypothetical protein